MDVRQLRYFIATAEEGHLGRAADRLHLSQPALSRQIQLLEQQFGAPLFTRTPKGVVLTQIGEMLLADARKVHHLFDQTVERIQRAARGELGTLEVGAFGTALFEYVPKLLARHVRKHPDVTVRLHHAPMEDLVAALRQGSVQVVFERRVLDEPDIVARVATREPAYLAVSEHHALAARDNVELVTLRGEPLINGRDIGRTRGTVEFCREHGFEPTVVREVADMTLGVVLVASGIGSCIVPASLLNLQLPGVVYRPLVTRSDASFDLYCYHLREPAPPPVLKALLDTMEGEPGEPTR